MPEVRHQKLQSCVDVMLCSDFSDGWSTVTMLYLTKQGWWDSLWRHTKACRTLTLSVLKLNVVRTALWDWPPTKQGRLMTTALLPHSPGLPLVSTGIHPPQSHLRQPCLAQAEIMPETTVFNHKDNPIPGSSNISGHCLMYGNRCSGSCLWWRLDASWASFVAASGRALLLTLGKELHFVLMWIKNTIHFNMLPEVWGSYLQSAEQSSQ